MTTAPSQSRCYTRTKTRASSGGGCERILTFCIGCVCVGAGIRGAVAVAGSVVVVIILLPRRGAVVCIAAGIVGLVHVLVIVAAQSARHLRMPNERSESYELRRASDRRCASDRRRMSA